MKLSRALEIVWQAGFPLDGSPPEASDRRYIPKSLNGGTGWGVWDRASQRFLSDREVRSIDPREEMRIQ